MDLGVHVIEPSGILDGTQTNSFRQQVDMALEKGTKILLIDLKDITFVDSSGLGVLVACLKNARAAGCKMYVCSINDQIRMLFELTSMDRVFEIFEDRAAFDATVLK
ncbi:STAS domain-containing protein [Leptothoe spongobia]|uniref:Anti-sigma factor antagonist n=1 Tax=Leptothoe spongobia TAU-MAC 1115 TaxID=1967444 RepID=A0A947DEJ7_9CYAN|nr:STAS domain-containing protein [Leptothoe spongobia TAU-MAC 1115]